MKNPKLQDLSNQQLAERFKELSLEQGDAESGNDMRTYIRRSQQVDDVGGAPMEPGTGGFQTVVFFRNIRSPDPLFQGLMDKTYW